MTHKECATAWRAGLRLKLPTVPRKFTGGAYTAGQNPLDYEILGEKAAALGRAGSKAESCVAHLNRTAPDDAQRPRLLREAAEAVYAYFIQRELCGLRRHDDIVREWRIPREVLVRLGAR
ncbi:hypothetical protein L598_002200000050 [Mesorhizobium sp. J18]|nr:hypothetical protein L598_002200000050 [Mesorhizobium sp. J18]